MILLRGLPSSASYNIFFVLHPIHVVLSALVTTSMYEIHKLKAKDEKPNLLILLVIGYLGAVGIASLSDSIIPYIGEILLDLPNRGIHLGFIEKWWLVNPLAVGGIAIAYLKPSTKFPHAGHVLLSTSASLFHILMAMGGTFPWYQYLFIFLFLFIAVWIPCCVSDIVFPLLFVRSEENEE